MALTLKELTSVEQNALELKIKENSRRPSLTKNYDEKTLLNRGCETGCYSSGCDSCDNCVACDCYGCYSTGS